MPSYVDSAGVTNLTTSIKNMADATYPSNEAIASVYDSTASYAVGDYCIHNGLLYKCTTAISTGGETWNPAHWTATNVTGEIGSGGGGGSGLPSLRCETVDLYDNETAEFSEYGADVKSGSIYWSVEDYPGDPSDGDVIAFTLDGIEYTAPVAYDNYSLYEHYAGNLNLYNSSLEDSGLPFLLVTSGNSWNQVTIYVHSLAESHTVSLSWYHQEPDGVLLEGQNGEWVITPGRQLPKTYAYEHPITSEYSCEFQQYWDERYNASYCGSGISISGPIKEGCPVTYSFDGAVYKDTVRWGNNASGDPILCFGDKAVVTDGAGSTPLYVELYLSDSTVMYFQFDMFTPSQGSYYIDLEFGDEDGMFLSNAGGEWVPKRAGTVPIAQCEKTTVDSSYTFVKNRYNNIYVCNVNTNEPTFRVGDVVTVVWDGTSYECIAFMGASYPTCGSESIGGQTPGDFPFLITQFPYSYSYGYGTAFAISIETLDTSATHNITITAHLPDGAGAVVESGEWIARKLNELPKASPFVTYLDGTYSFSWASAYQKYVSFGITPSAAIHNGDELTVTWDSTEYAVKMVGQGAQSVDGTTLPFRMGIGGSKVSFETSNSSATHTIKVTGGVQDGTIPIVQNGKWVTQSNNSGDKVMRVNLTYSNHTYTSVETYDEILAAINNGYVVIVSYSNKSHYYSYIANNRLYFLRYEVNYNSVYEYSYYVYKSNGATTWSYSTNYFITSIPSEYKKQPVIWIADNDDSESMATHPYVVSYSELEYFDYLSEIEGDNYPLLHYVKSSFSDSYDETNSTDANYEEYRLVKAWTTHEWSEDNYCNVWTVHVVFGATAIENGVVKYKTFTFEGDIWEYISYMYPTYSETTLGLAPTATGVSF